jgi:PAP2 superfamily
LTAETGDNIGSLSTAAPIQSGGPAVATHSTAAVPQHARTRWWIEALAIVWLGWVYDAITNLAPLRLHTALAHAKEILSAEQTLHLDPEHSLDSWLVAHHSLGIALSYYYDNAHFIVTLGLLGYMWWQRADIYRPLRNSLVLANVLAFVVFWRFPVAPPRMLSGFTDVVAASHTVGSWHTGALASQANQLAAMPSLHLAWAAWCTLAIWRITTHRWLRALGVVYPFVTAFAVLATGNHFVFDIFGGLATIALSVLIVRLFEGRLRSFQIAGFRRRSARASADATVYGMSQTCYEVQDQLD